MVPETLEPSLQLASAVLSQLNMPPDDVQEAIQEFRRAHMGELQVRTAAGAHALDPSAAHAVLNEHGSRFVFCSLLSLIFCRRSVVAQKPHEQDAGMSVYYLCCVTHSGAMHSSAPCIACLARNTSKQCLAM